MKNLKEIVQKVLEANKTKTAKLRAKIAAEKEKRKKEKERVGKVTRK